MSFQRKQTSQQGIGHQDGEVGDSALDAVSGGQGGQPVQKMDTIVVTAKRIPANTAAVQKMDPIVVTATRLPPDLSGTQVAAAGARSKKPS